MKERKEFEVTYTIRVYDTDSSGVIFYGNIFFIFQYGYEEFLSHIWPNWGSLFNQKKLHIPVIHATGNIKKPIKVGEKIQIQIKVLEIRTHSFCVGYHITRQNNVLGDGKTVHVFTDSNNSKKTIPKEFQAKLEQYRVDE